MTPSLQTLLVNAGNGNDIISVTLDATVFGSANQINLGAGNDTATITGNSLAANAGAINIDGAVGLDTFNVAGQLGPTLTIVNTNEPAAVVANTVLNILNVTATRAAHEIAFNVGIRADSSNGGYGAILLDHTAANASDAFNYQVDRLRVFQSNPGELLIRAYTTAGGIDTNRVVIRAKGYDPDPGRYGLYRTTVRGNDAANEFHVKNSVRGDCVTLDGGNGDDRFFVQNYYGGPNNYDILYGDYTLLGGAGNDRMDYDATSFNTYNASFNFFDNEIQFAGDSAGHVKTPSSDVEAQNFYGTNPGFGNGSNNYFLHLNGGGHGLSIFGGPSTEYFHVDPLDGFGDATLSGGGGNDQLLFDSGAPTSRPFRRQQTRSVGRSASRFFHDRCLAAWRCRAEPSHSLILVTSSWTTAITAESRTCGCRTRLPQRLSNSPLAMVINRIFGT